MNISNIVKYVVYRFAAQETVIIVVNVEKKFCCFFCENCDQSFSEISNEQHLFEITL